jgi:DNA polymerase-1
MKKLLIVDVSNLFFRSFYGSESLVTSYGLPVQALHGFVRGMNAILRDHKPDYIALALEGEGPSFRKTIEPLYKANRPELNDDLRKQLNLLPKLIDALGYKTYKAAGFEADDIIGTIAVSACTENSDILVEIASSDKDFAQLVNPQITLLDLMKGIKLNSFDIYDKYGVWPHQFVDYLSIVGDSSDNVKGVAGIGPKGAAKLLQQYETLHQVYANVQNVKGANKTKLLESGESAFLAKKLVKINTSVPINFKLEETVYKGPKEEDLRKIFRELEFKELESTMLGQDVMIVNGVAIGVRS